MTSENVIILKFPAMRVLVSRAEWFFYNSEMQFIVLLQHVTFEVEIVVNIYLMGCLRLKFMREDEK